MKKIAIIIFLLSLLQVCFGLSYVLAQRQLIDFQVYYQTVLPALLSLKNSTTSLYDQSIYAFFHRLGLGMNALELSYLVVLLLFAITIWKYKKHDDLVRNNHIDNLTFDTYR